jgi:hypothetical protein
MEEGKFYRNTRTGEVSECFKVMQSSWDTESDSEKIKDFFSYTIPGIRNAEDGDILEEIPSPLNIKFKEV